MPGDHTIAEGLVQEHVVVVGTVGDEGVHFEERTFVKKQANPVACRASAAGANGFLTLESSTEASRFALGSQLLKHMVRGAVHGISTPFRFLIQTLIPSAFLDVLHTGWPSAQR